MASKEPLLQGVPAQPAANAADSPAEEASKPFVRGTDLDISKGPAAHRSCTDLCFLLLLFAACAAYLFTKVLAWKTGRPALLTGAVDWKGRVCGYDEGVKDLKYLYFPSISPPHTQLHTVLPHEKLVPVCTSKCPQSFALQRESNECSEEDRKYGYCSWYGGETKLVVKKFCLFKGMDEVPGNSPTDVCTRDETGKTNCSGVENASELKELGITKWRELLHDVSQSKLPLLIGALCTIAVGYIYLLAVQQFTAIFVWAGTLSIIAAPFIGSYMFFQESKTLEVDEDREDALIASYFLLFIGVLFTFLLCWFFKSIRVAIAVLEVAAKFCQDVVSSWTLPIIFAGINVLYLAIWACGFGLQITMLRVHEISNLTQYTDRFEPLDDMYYVYLALDVLMLFWITNFIAALADMTVAGAVGFWYFTPIDPKTGGKRPANNPVKSAMWNALFWHAGSAAFGALLIATLIVIRIIISLIQSVAKSQAKNRDGNKVQEAVADTAHSVAKWAKRALKWIENIVKFVTGIAYVQVALLGRSFCESAGIAIGLWVRNAARFAFVHQLSSIVSFVGVLVIAQTPMIVTAIIIIGSDSYLEAVTDPLAVAMLAFLFGITIAMCVMRVFSGACEAVLQCYIADEEMAQYDDVCVDGGAEYTPLQLRQFIDHHHNAIACKK